MKNKCPYCSTLIEHDGEDNYVQCPFCGKVSKYESKKLEPSE